MKKKIAQLAVVACAGFAVMNNQSEAASLQISIGSDKHNVSSVISLHLPEKHVVRHHAHHHHKFHPAKPEPRHLERHRKEHRPHGR